MFNVFTRRTLLQIYLHDFWSTKRPTYFNVPFAMVTLWFKVLPFCLVVIGPRLNGGGSQRCFFCDTFFVLLSITRLDFHLQEKNPPKMVLDFPESVRKSSISKIHKIYGTLSFYTATSTVCSKRIVCRRSNLSSNSYSASQSLSKL